MSKNKKEGHDPSPVPDPETPKLGRAWAGNDYGVESAARTKDLPQGETAEPHAAAPPPQESLTKPPEPDLPLFKCQVRNGFVSIDAGIRAGSAAEAESQFRDWLCAGLVVKEG